MMVFQASERNDEGILTYTNVSRSRARCIECSRPLKPVFRAVSRRKAAARHLDGIQSRPDLYDQRIARIRNPTYYEPVSVALLPLKTARLRPLHSTTGRRAAPGARDPAPQQHGEAPGRGIVAVITRNKIGRNEMQRQADVQATPENQPAIVLSMLVRD